MQEVNLLGDQRILILISLGRAVVSLTMDASRVPTNLREPEYLSAGFLFNGV